VKLHAFNKGFAFPEQFSFETVVEQKYNAFKQFSQILDILVVVTGVHSEKGLLCFIFIF
jgi:hypothetical protein